MIHIFGKRGSGKSTKLIRMAIKDDATIVVPTIRHVAFMEDLAKKLGCFDKLKCITLAQYKASYGIYQGKYYIDELDACLSSVGIAGYSNTTSDYCYNGDSYKLAWANNEVNRALDREINSDGDDEDGYCYAEGCYKSALDAFAVLCEYGHSGASISITANILNRLINGQPLTPIEDIPEDWREAWKENDSVKHYQNKRLSSLFKDVYSDGRIEYSDVNAYECIDEGSDIPYHGGGAGQIFHKYFPITFPYYPPTKKYRIITRTVLFDPKNGDFDTKAYLKIISPDGKETEVNRYFGETKNGWQEIDCYEFYRREVAAKEREEGKNND